MKTSFLDYYKLILSKVSFDLVLMQKEYAKALQVLSENEAAALTQWVKESGLNLKTRTKPTKLVA